MAQTLVTTVTYTCDQCGRVMLTAERDVRNPSEPTGYSIQGGGLKLLVGEGIGRRLARVSLCGDNSSTEGVHLCSRQCVTGYIEKLLDSVEDTLGVRQLPAPEPVVASRPEPAPVDPNAIEIIPTRAYSVRGRPPEDVTSLVTESMLEAVASSPNPALVLATMLREQGALLDDDAVRALERLYDEPDQDYPRDAEGFSA